MTILVTGIAIGAACALGLLTFLAVVYIGFMLWSVMEALVRAI